MGTKLEHDEDSNSSSLIANNSGEASEESSINLCFSKEIESIKQNLKTQDSDSLRERMVTIENQLKKLQQCLSSTTSHSASMAGSTSAVSGGTMGISSSTG